ncbi:hypothetical protein OTU49_009222 [Cherax quadricarinatus]|uniref:Uncharacterized protein n=1 Tax=Cherax quadricarinatus TaxID=27406 RepID=A0AAW0WAV0_CHEQU|nr:heme-binding protein 2-like isoform X2 [Cherax quadricarinatus]
MQVYEERIYPARKWACITMAGLSQQELVSPMFRALFNYIAGKNDPNIRMDMTSPVTTYVVPGAGPACESTFTMGFLVPEEHQQIPPPAADKTIFIEERPELTVLTRRFGGYTNDEVIIKEAKELAEAIKKNGEIGVNFNQYYVAGYDPPFKLFGRRNEIWFVKTKSTDNQEGKELTANEDESKMKEANGSIVKDSEDIKKGDQKDE